MGDMKNIAPAPALVEVAGRGHVVIGAKQPRVLFAQQTCDLIRRPQVEPALLPFAVGVLSAVEPPFERGHLAQHIVQRLFHYPPVLGVPADLPGMQVSAVSYTHLTLPTN